MNRLSLLLLLAIAQLAQADTSQLRYSDGWIKQLPPVVPMRAGYVTISNPSKQAHEIIAVQSESFERVEMHESKLDENGVLRMVMQESITVPAGGSVELKPGGKHLMMFAPLHNLALGDRIGLTLVFGDGTSQQLQLEVKR